jgi:hypothetical protein
MKQPNGARHPPQITSNVQQIPPRRSVCIGVVVLLQLPATESYLHNFTLKTLEVAPLLLERGRQAQTNGRDNKQK